MLKKKKLAIIREFYPNAATTIDHVNRIIDFVEDKLELEPSQVMMADSICSDDVNSIQYPVRSQEFLGPFKMGGLDGFPFTGLSGMAAFASHVPDNGAVLIYYGPHIGISKEGEIGQIHRFGQDDISDCCGAAKGALNKLLANQVQAGHMTEMDYQMNTIEQILFSQKERIAKANNAMIEATDIIYEAIDRRIHELVGATKYNCQYLILMGVILINSDADIGSFSAVKRLDIIHLKEGRTESLLAQFGA